MNNHRVALADVGDIRGISIRFLSSYLKSKGIPTNLLFPLIPQGDAKNKARLTKNQMSRVLAFLNEKQITHLGFYLMTNHLRGFQELARYLRRQGWQGRIIAGGVHPTLRPEETLSEGIDYVVVGPGEQSLCDIVQEKDFAGISGLVYRRNGTIVKNEVLKEAYIDLDLLPFLDYDFSDHYLIRDGATRQFDAALFRNMSPWKGTYYYLTTTRGCLYQCAYCCNVNRRFMRRASVARTFAELHWAKAKLPFLRGCNIQDDSFFMGSDDWIREFSTRLKTELNWPFIARVMPRFCTQERLEMLKMGGLRYVSIGLQGSERMNREFYGRKETNQSFITACNLMANLGIKFVIDVILDVPYETEDDLREVARTLNSLKRPFKINLYSMTPYPGSTFYDRVVADGLLEQFGADAYETPNHASRPGAYKTPQYWRKLIEIVIPLYQGKTIDRLIEAGPDDAAAIAQVDRLYTNALWKFNVAQRLRSKAPRLFEFALEAYMRLTRKRDAA